MIDPTHPSTVLVFYTSAPASSSLADTVGPSTTDTDMRQLYLARSTDGGSTWKNSLVLEAGTTGGQNNTIAHTLAVEAIDRAGNVYIAYSERLGGSTQTHVYLTVLRRNATTTSKPVRVDGPGLGANVFPSVAVGDPGKVAISWYGTAARDHDDTHAIWSELLATSLDALSPRPTFTRSRVSTAIPIHVGPICTGGASCDVAYRNLADFQSVAVDPCGGVQLTWTEDSQDGGSTHYARQTSGTRLRTGVC